jgi:catechol 2,3-dioxygenase-like lactoylglutathione lyase family enzyme
MSLGPAVPALPISETAAATRFYRERLGFTIGYEEADFAIVRRDDCTLHLWLAADESWRDREDFRQRPVSSGAERFLAGMASCRIEVGDAESLARLFEELRDAGVLHYASSSLTTTDYGTQEFHVSDADGNLLTFFRRV